MPGYKLETPKTPLVDWTALWHIAVVSVAAGCGLALAFGLILLGTEIADRHRGTATGESAFARGGGYALSALAAAFCVAAVALGIWVMVHPAKSKPAKVVPVAAVATRTPNA